jgi:hypothetical protein
VQALFAKVENTPSIRAPRFMAAPRTTPQAQRSRAFVWFVLDADTPSGHAKTTKHQTQFGRLAFHVVARQSLALVHAVKMLLTF